MEQARFKRRTITMEVLQNQQQKKRIHRTVFYTVLFILVTAVFLTVSFAVFFRVRIINITGNEQYSNEEIIAVIPVQLEDNLYSFKAEDVKNEIIKAFPYIGNVNVTRSIPSHLNIEITETNVAMYNEIAGDYYLLSKDLKVLDRVENTSEVPIDAIQLKTSDVLRCIVGETASFVDTRSYDAIKELYKDITDNNIQQNIKSIDIKNRFDIYLKYDDRFEVYMGDMEYSNIKIQFLVGILEELKVEDTGKIDISDYREAPVALD